MHNFKFCIRDTDAYWAFPKGVFHVKRQKSLCGLQSIARECISKTYVCQIFGLYA